MRLPIWIFIAILVTARCTAGDHISVDLALLKSVPASRNEVLRRCQITNGDGSLDVSAKKMAYIAWLKATMLQLSAAYYQHDDFPGGIDHAVEIQAEYLAGLEYPETASTGCSFYARLVQDFTIEIYEKQVVLCAKSICRQLTDVDIANHNRPGFSFSAWQGQWNLAGAVKDGPNQALEPTVLASTPRADARVAPAKTVAHH